MRAGCGHRDPVAQPRIGSGVWANNTVTSLQRPKQWDDKAVLTERISRGSADALNDEFTVSDPTTWTAPWTAMIPLKAGTS